MIKITNITKKTYYISGQVISKCITAAKALLSAKK